MRLRRSNFRRRCSAFRSRTPYGQRKVFSHGYVLADLTGDGEIDGADYFALDYDALTSPPGARAADLNGDGVVDSADIAILDDAYYWADRLPRNDPLVSYPRGSSFRLPLVNGDVSPAGMGEFGHQGLMHDEESGLVYNRARMLSPGVGRFMQRDPLGYVDGMGLYEYVRSTPLVKRDSTGNRISEDDRPPDIDTDINGRPVPPPSYTPCRRNSTDDYVPFDEDYERKWGDRDRCECVPGDIGEDARLSRNRKRYCNDWAGGDIDGALSHGVHQKWITTSDISTLPWNPGAGRWTTRCGLGQTMMASHLKKRGEGKPVNCRNTCAPGYHKFALYTHDWVATTDFHFVTEHCDSTWSGKRGAYGVTATTLAKEDFFGQFEGCFCAKGNPRNTIADIKAFWAEEERKKRAIQELLKGHGYKHHGL